MNVLLYIEGLNVTLKLSLQYRKSVEKINTTAKSISFLFCSEFKNVIGEYRKGSIMIIQFFIYNNQRVKTDIFLDFN